MDKWIVEQLEDAIEDAESAHATSEGYCGNGQYPEATGTAQMGLLIIIGKVERMIAFAEENGR